MVTASRENDRMTMFRASDAAGATGTIEANGIGGLTAARRSDRYLEELRRILARFGTRKAIARGDSLFDPIDTSEHVYIVERGMIDISLPEDSAGRPIASFHAGATFMFDFGGYQIAALEAAEDSVVVDLPLARLRRLCRQEMELRLLLRQCHAFDLKSFLDACYPARSRFRLAHATHEKAARRGGADGERRQPATEFLIPLAEDPAAPRARRYRRKKRNSERLHASAARKDAGGDGES